LRSALLGAACLAPEAAAAAEADACSEQPATSNQQAGRDWLPGFENSQSAFISVEIQTGIVASTQPDSADYVQFSINP
jgi:hypothetical protein